MFASVATVRRLGRIAVMLAVAVWTRDARAQITVSGSPFQLTVNTAVAGFAPAAATESSTTYAITSNARRHAHYAITAQIDTDMPSGVTLTIALQAQGATSLGAVTLSPTAQSVVTGISIKISGQSITYMLNATAVAGVVPVQTRSVTLTLVNTP